MRRWSTFLVLGALAALSARAAAQSPPDAAAGGAGGAAAAPAPLPPGFAVGAGRAPIVGGNVASARERALAEAFKQAVGEGITAAVGPEARAAQPKVAAQVLGRARSYVRRYRTLEEGEVPGATAYAVRVEAEIDEPALRRAFEKPAATPVATAGGSAGAGGGKPSYLVVGAGPPEAATAAASALGSAGARIQTAAPSDAGDPARAVEAAARAGMGAVAFVSGSASAEGKVRGPGLDAVSCTLGIKVLAAGTGKPMADESASLRSFGPREDAARADCFTRAAASAVPRVVPPPSPAAGGGADLRTVVIDAQVTEPAAVPALLKLLRGLGSVSSVEVRRVLPGAAELWVRTRLGAAALAAALARDAGTGLIMGAPEVQGDLVRVRVRRRDDAAGGAAAAVPAGGAR
jgi:hypothetical protein